MEFLKKLFRGDHTNCNASLTLSQALVAAQGDEINRLDAEICNLETETNKYKSDNVTLMSELAKLQARAVALEDERDEARAVAEVEISNKELAFRRQEELEWAVGGASRAAKKAKDQLKRLRKKLKPKKKLTKSKKKSSLT